MVGSFVIYSFANYALSLGLSRVLSVLDYGTFGILSSILLLEGLLATAGFPWMLSTTVARYTGPKFIDLRSSALATALIGNLAVGVLSGAVVFVLMNHLAPGYPLIPILAASASFFICANAIWLGLFQGERRFSLLAGLRIGDSITKAILGLTLAGIGFGVEGAAGGIVAGAAFITVWGAARVRGLGAPMTLMDLPALRGVAWAAVAQFGFGLLMNLDMLAVRGFGTGDAAATGAGYYQAALVLARAPVYVSIALLSAVFPFLARTAGARDSETRLLRTVLRVIAFVSVPAAVLLIAAPEDAIGLFFPPAYAPAVPLLRINAVAGLFLIALDVAIIARQATRSMRTAAIAVFPTVVVEVVILLYAVPRYGAEGAAWALCIAAAIGVPIIWIPTARQWPLRSVLPSVRIGVALLALGFTALLLQIHGWLWLIEVMVLWAIFLLIVWLLGGISAAELQSLSPAPARRFLHWLAKHEPRRP